MTTAQERKIKQIRRAAEDQFFHAPDQYEFKRFSVEDLGFSVCVIAEVGMKGDEGTLAAILGRDRVQLFVGKRGGITYVNKRGTVKSLPGLNLYTVICANH